MTDLSSRTTLVALQPMLPVLTMKKRNHRRPPNSTTSTDMGEAWAKLLHPEAHWTKSLQPPAPRHPVGSSAYRYTMIRCHLHLNPERRRTCPRPAIKAVCGDRTQFHLAMPPTPTEPRQQDVCDGVLEVGISALRACSGRGSWAYTEVWRMQTMTRSLAHRCFQKEPWEGMAIGSNHRRDRLCKARLSGSRFSASQTGRALVDFISTTLSSHSRKAVRDRGSEADKVPR